MNRQQLQEFGAFQTAFRYAEEIQRLEQKLDKATNDKERDKIQAEIDKRKNTNEYKKYGHAVEKYIQ